jgi:hypothetical protein
MLNTNYVSRAKRWLTHINKLIALNAPEPIIGHAVWGLFSLTAGYMGESVTTHLAKRVAEDARQRVALCAECDNEILPTHSHPAICAACQVKAIGEQLAHRLETPDQCSVCGKIDDECTYLCAKCDKGFCYEHFGNDGEGAIPYCGTCLAELNLPGGTT